MSDVSDQGVSRSAEPDGTAPKPPVDSVEAQQTPTANQNHMVGPKNVEYAVATGAQDIRETIVIKEDDLFLLTDLNGNVPRGNINGLGLYHKDTRFLSAYE